MREGEGEEQEQINEENVKIENEQKNGKNQERENQNIVNSDDRKIVQYNVEEYFPCSSKHDQYSCSCCEHFYEDSIKINSKLPNVKCEVCGNEINQRSLLFYKKKYKNNKKYGKGKGKGKK